MKIKSVKKACGCIKVYVTIGGVHSEFAFGDPDYKGLTAEVDIPRLYSKQLHMHTAITEVIDKLQSIIDDLKDFDEASARIKSTFSLYEENK